MDKQKLLIKVWVISSNVLLVTMLLWLNLLIIALLICLHVVAPLRVMGFLLHKKPIDLVPLPIQAHTVKANAFTKHMHEIHFFFFFYMHEIHDDVQWKIEISNESYKQRAHLRRKFVELKEGDMVMVHNRPERYPKGCTRSFTQKVPVLTKFWRKLILMLMSWLAERYRYK